MATARRALVLRSLGCIERALRAIYDGRGYPHPWADQVLPLQLEATPIPWARARSRGRRHFTSTRTKHHGWNFQQVFSIALETRPAFTGAVAMAAIFRMPDARWTDADNLSKLVLDAGTKAKLWRDDSHVTAPLPYLELDKKRPRTLLAFAPIRSSIPRYPKTIEGERACLHCGCTERRACPGGCSWASRHVCTLCRHLRLG